MSNIKEHYSYKILPEKWKIVPILFLIIGGIIAYENSKTYTSNNSLFASLFIIDVIIILIMGNYEEKWKKITNPTIYPYGYIYTDSIIEKITYNISKVICYLVSIFAVGIISIFIFSWLGTVSIAPTTIIIILLIMMISNQEKIINNL